MEKNLFFLVFALYSLVQGGDLDISLCDARQWYLKCAAEGLFDGPLTGSQESVQYEIEDILLKSRNDPTQRQVDCILLEQFENILKKKSKGNEGDNSEAVNEVEVDETDILEEETEHDVTASTENTYNKDEDNQVMDETNSLPDEVTHSSHLPSNSHGETSEDEDSKNAAEMGTVGESKEQNGNQEMATESNGEQFHVMEENEQNTIDQNSDKPKTTKQNKEYEEPQLQTTEHNEEHQHTMEQTDEQPQTSEQHGTNTQKEHNEEQHKSTEQSEHDDKVQQTTEHSVENQQTTDHSEEQQQTTEQTVEHTTIQSDDQLHVTENGGDQQQKAAPQEEDQQNIKERNDYQTQTTDQNRTHKKTTEQDEDQPQMMEQNHKTQITERNDESNTMEQNRAQPQAIEQYEFQSEFIDSIIADLFQADDASEQDSAANTGSLNSEQTMPIQTQQNSENADVRTHALQDEAQLSGFTQEKEIRQEMQADKTSQTTEHLKTDMHEIEKGNEKHMEKETDKASTTEQYNDASPETNKIRPTDNISNSEHLQNVKDFDSESGYSDAEKDNNLLNFGVCRTDKSSATDIFLSRYLPSINTINESTTEKCSDCHGFETDNKNNMPDEFRDKDIIMNKHESTVSSKKLVQKDSPHDLPQEHTDSTKKDSKLSDLVPSNENTNDEGYVLNSGNEVKSDD
ncbi:putative mediator of RNA polymerase II transcription subunit 26, partial [Mytilus trossulus]|uniref:putative mediator of RNA polymerase II transcription subunit 26 n=1 Tax=Mytilus trossulus TaxID=6551 RepID=UPI0030077464